VKDGIKARAFDTGGTILDWHSWIVTAAAGARRGVTADWHVVANDYRRRSLARMLAAKATAPPLCDGPTSGGRSARPIPLRTRPAILSSTVFPNSPAH
jgi:hypothetical protein